MPPCLLALGPEQTDEYAYRNSGTLSEESRWVVVKKVWHLERRKPPTGSVGFALGVRRDEKAEHRQGGGYS